MSYRYLCFNPTRKTWTQQTNLQFALRSTKNENYVFCHAGMPNPHVVYPIVNGKVCRNIVIRGIEKMREYTKKKEMSKLIERVNKL